MKINNKYFLTFLMAIVFQFAFSLTTFAQTAVEEETTNKCERCATYLEKKDMESYAKENCRVFNAICSRIEHNGPVILGTNDTMAVESTSGNRLMVAINDEIPLVIFMEGLKTTNYNVTPVVTILNAKKKVITKVETNIFQQYVFGKDGKMNVKGIKTIKKLDNRKRILATDIKIPKVASQKGYIKVDFVTIDRETKKKIVVTSLVKNVVLK